MNAFWKGVGILPTAALLVACGGGGDDSSPSTTVGEAQGVYTGSFSSVGFPVGRFSTLVLDNDEIWTLYGEEGSNGELIVYGLIQGQGASNRGSFTSSALRDYSFNGDSASGSINATYTVGSTFSGTVSSAGQSVSFAGVVPAPGVSSYVYNTPAVLSDITGTWSGTSMGGVNSSYTISAGGTFSGVNEFGCGFSGTIAPRSSGKNVFDVTLINNTSQACGAASGLTGRGVALSAVLANASRQLIVTVVTSDRVYGSAIFATR